jgi:hypothetical protein
MRVQGLPFDEMDESRQVPRIVDEWIGAGKILDIRAKNKARVNFDPWSTKLSADE